MRPLRLTIPGEYWDCQIYRGRLYLWNMDGCLSVYNWERLIEALSEDPGERLALTCAFSRSDYLYDPNFALLFSDRDVVEVIRRKFNRVSQRDLTLTPQHLATFLYGRQDNPFKEFPTDTEIYKSVLYAALDNGLWATTAHRSDRKYPVSSRPRQMWDCGLFAIRAQGRRLALAAGDDGLWEFPLADAPVRLGFFDEPDFEDDHKDLWQVDTRHSSMANWSFSSIYSSSFLDGGYLAAFGWYGEEPHHRKRVYKGVVSHGDIFRTNDSGFSWGTQEKIYCATGQGIKVVRYEQGKLDDGEAFQPLDSIPVEGRRGDVIGGGTASFGVVVEYQDGLLVLRSDDTYTTIPDLPVRWRVFPRSQRYENHLHVIVDNALHVYSFNHDYFVDQESKRAGIAYWRRGGIRGGSGVVP